jgi:hypothetical protein
MVQEKEKALSIGIRKPICTDAWNRRAKAEVPWQGRKSSFRGFL